MAEESRTHNAEGLKSLLINTSRQTRLAFQSVTEKSNNSKIDCTKSIHIHLETEAHKDGQCSDTIAVND